MACSHTVAMNNSLTYVIIKGLYLLAMVIITHNVGCCAQWVSFNEVLFLERGYYFRFK